MKALLGFSTIEALCRFQETSGSAAVRVGAEVQDRVTQLLAPNFNEPRQFIDALCPYRLNSVLSGPFVSSLIDSSSCEQYTWLDIISGHDTFCDALTFLIKKEHAIIKGVLADIPGMSSDAFNSALHLETSRGAKIRLIQSAGSSPLFSITHYYSTHLMNFITADFLVIAYPKLTFIHQGLLADDEYPANAEPTSFTVVEGDLEAGAKGDVNSGGSATPSAFITDKDKWRTFSDDDCVRIRLKDVAVDVGFLKAVRWRLGG